MEQKKFNRLLQDYDCKKIIQMYCDCKINLTDIQLEKVINLKNRKEVKKRCLKQNV